MSRLADLHHAYTDQNVWLQCLLGIVSETGRLARSLPRPRRDRSSTPREIDPFVAALLGVLSLRAEIGAAARESTPPRALAETARLSDRGRRSRRLPGKPGDLMR
jgi:hypothetical protein